MGRLKHVAASALLGALISCSNSMYGSSGTGYGGSCTPTATQVCMVNTSFSPATRTVAAGTTVTWVNGDGITHTTTSDSIPATSSAWNVSVASGNTTSVLFNVKGTYKYHCSIHGTATSGMRGTIIVN